MGKKGTWFSSAIKRLFTKQEKKHPLNNNENNKGKEKRFKHGSFIPIFREPSSIEHILEEFDQHNNLLFTQHHPTTQSQPQPQPQPQSQPQPQPQPQSQAQPQTQSQPQPKPKPQSQPQPQSQTKPHAQPQLRPQPSSSSGRHVPPPPPRVVHQKPKISHRPEPTLQQRHLSATRIQAVYRGHMARRNVRGLTGLVRLQRVVTGQNVKRQTTNAMKQMQLLVRVQTQVRSQRIQMLKKNQALKPQHNPHNKQADEHWDDSFITKEERQARLQRKEDAVIKRERAMAYAYSHQLRKDQTSLVSGYPSWWNWSQGHTPSPLKDHQFATTPTPGRTHTQPTTPMSSRSMTPSERLIKYSKARKGYPMKDDDSLMSCPPFSVPNYMSPTVSARAKARAAKERSAPSTPGSESSKRRFSFPFTLKSPGSIGDLSMNSVPASLGRKPFNRFV